MFLCWLWLVAIFVLLLLIALGMRKPRPTITFGPPEPKTPSPPLGERLAQAMANFETQIDNTQKTLATVTLADGLVPVDGLTLTVMSGDGSFSFLDNSGNSLPNNQVYLISGSAIGDTVYQVAVQWAGGPDVMATAVLHVTAPPPAVNISFAPGEPK